MRLARFEVPVVLLAGLALAACTQPAPGPAAGAGSAKPRVAFVLKTLNNPFFIEMQKGAREAAERLGVELVVQAAERELDVDKQMQIIENLIETRVGALCITPSGSREVVPAIAKANAARIPVVIVDTRVDPKAAQDAGIRLDGFVGSDNYEGGKVAGEYLLRVTGGKAQVGLLEGIPGHETGDSRLKGFHDAVRGAAGVKIVASQTANWERDQGYNVFQNMLQAHPEIDALFACSDLMALGAVEAIAAAGRTGKVRVIGFDALDDARKAIAAGTMLASVAQFPSEMGRQAVEDAVALVRGGAPAAERKVRIELVTRETLEAQK
ncbi:MAG TPA: sugar ABC transporter substrate-binding protein [Vicinamibacteria bacterium]|jgi:ribose transport system substrate-binding protein